ncbi:MAG: MlaD family protein [Pseudomonadota bacterium]
METRANYVLIGGFVMSALAALVLFAVWISRVQFNQEFDRYDVVFEGAVNGLGEGGEVRFNGIKVGEVTDLALDRNDPNNVIARIRVDAQTPVRADSVATLEFLGITGVTFVQIRAGSSDLPMLKDIATENPPRLATEQNEFFEIVAGGQDVLVASQETLTRINAAFSDENVEALTTILSNLEAVSERIAGDDELLEHADDAIIAIAKAGRAVEAASNALAGASSGLSDSLDDMAVDAAGLLKDARAAITQAQAAFTNAEGALASAQTQIAPSADKALEEFALTAQDLRALILRLDSIAQQLDQDPRGFVLGEPKPYED